MMNILEAEGVGTSRMRATFGKLLNTTLHVRPQAILQPVIAISRGIFSSNLVDAMHDHVTAAMQQPLMSALMLL